MKYLALILLFTPLLFNGQLDSSCYLIPDTGPCFGLFPKYFYNQTTQQCETFTWGGCAGLVPFETLIDCQNSCSGSGNVIDLCSNLLENPGAEDGLIGWNFSTGSGTDWTTQGSTFGSQSFVSSYGWSTKNQTVDLIGLGFDANYLDLAPELYVQEMYTGHAVNYNDEYYFHLELRDSLGNVIASYDDGSQSSPLISDTSWQTSNHTFINYGAGLRYIYFESGGKDVEFWAGYYGTKMDEAIIQFAIETGITNNAPSLSANANGVSYQWLDCDNNYALIVGENNQTFTASSNGNYAVEITTNNCTDTSICEAVNNVGLFESYELINSKIYPNPSNGEFSISFDNNQDYISVSIKTITGSLISNSSYKNVKNIALKIENVAGIYLLELKGNNGLSAISKIIKR
jgi:hypothetical protein